MPPNSYQFLLFLPLVVAAYYLLAYRHRWALLLVASYVFYATWSPSFLVWIALSTLLGYALARLIERTAHKPWRVALLALSILTNLGMLLSLKYADFASGIWHALSGQAAASPALLPSLVLPVGISFYTLQVIGYTIDVYRGHTVPEKHLGLFALYVSFFPKLIAGPIERAEHLIPQFQRKHVFAAARVLSGLRLVLWGLFKKAVVADRLAVYVNAVYTQPLDYAGWSVVIATLFCGVQIYADFSGYSDIALGAARTFGLELVENFRQPYCATSVSAFWRRWHVSLSRWFRDYLYIPLGGNRVTRARWYLNLFVVFLVSGLWHGANWTFVVWGALHGTYVVVEVWSRRARDWVARAVDLDSRGVGKVLGWVTTFALVSFAWIFFQSPSVSHALLLVRNLFSFRVASDILAPWAGLTEALGLEMAFAWALVGLLALVHLVRDRLLPLPAVVVTKPWARWAADVLLTLAVINLGVSSDAPFIYAGF